MRALHALSSGLVIACMSCRAAPLPDPPRAAADLYLPPAEAHGSPYCLNPDSGALRELLTQPPLAAEAALDRRALAADVLFLREALRKVYAGWPELVQHRTFDVNAFFERWHGELLEAPGEVDFRSGVIDRLIVLKRAVMDLHLQPKGWGRKMRQLGGLEVTEYLGDGSAPDLQACEVEGAVEVLRHTLRNAHRLDAGGERREVVAVSLRGEALPERLSLRCGATRLSLKRRGALQARPDPEDAPLYAFSAHGDTAVIVVRRLWGDAAQLATLKRLAAEYATHRGFKRLVFDFRGNGGGDDGYIYSWIDEAKRGAWTTRPSVAIEGGLAPCAAWNAAVSFQIRTGSVDEAEAIQAREAERRAWPAHVPPVRHRVFQGQRRGDSDAPYLGRVFVLVDRRSASSGESGPEALRAALGATLVGERTAGYLEYGDLRTIVLPHTGIEVRVPSKRNYYDPPAEGVGLEVELYLGEEDLGRPAEALLPLLPQQPRQRYHLVD